MNIPSDVVKEAIGGLKSTPALLAILLINCIVLAMFGFVLHEVSSAMERRETLLKACIDRRP